LSNVVQTVSIMLSGMQAVTCKLWLARHRRREE
jgi:hypothetical protein